MLLSGFTLARLLLRTLTLDREMGVAFVRDDCWRTGCLVVNALSLCRAFAFSLLWVCFSLDGALERVIVRPLLPTNLDLLLLRDTVVEGRDVVASDTSCVVPAETAFV